MTQRTGGVVLAALAISALVPRPALACGGFFCSTTPVQQAGERIVYGIEADGTVTMSVEITYQGDDDDFAWILPVPVPPEVSLGDSALFTALDAATAPSFRRNDVTRGTCRPHPVCVFEDDCRTVTDTSSGCSYDGSYVAPVDYVDASAGHHDASPSPVVWDGSVTPGVTVFSEAPVGPYDSVVLGAATAAEVLTWLSDHEYDIPAAAAPLLEPYAAAGHVFVALRLRSDADTRLLQPVTLRMASGEACLPIRLTPVASAANLPITAYFLASGRAVASNYSHADVDATNLAYYNDSLDPTQRWNDAVVRAVDELDGQAFVTEYAGQNPRAYLTRASVAHLAEETDPHDYLSALSALGYVGDARLLTLFRRYLVAPASRLDTDYYNCLVQSDVRACGAPVSFDPAGLTASITREITEPGNASQALVDRHPYLTRLTTSMRPAKMTIDPVFVIDADLPRVSNVHTATYVTECSSVYYSEGAPNHWEIGATIFASSSGFMANDVAYCARTGAVPAGTATACAPAMETSSWGCDTFVLTGATPLQGGLLAMIGALVVARRARRKRSRETAEASAPR